MAPSLKPTRGVVPRYPVHSRMNLVYFGSGAFGLPTLKKLAKMHTIRALVTQPDRPAGRRGLSTPTPVAQWANADLPDVPVYKPERLNREVELIEQLRSIASGAFVVIAYGQKLGPALLEGRFAINLHGSLLPRWRGAAPINAALLAGDTNVGNTVITLADRMDAGLILAQSRRDLSRPSGDPEASGRWPLHCGDLHDLLAEDGPDLVVHVLDAFSRGTLTPRPQDESLVTLAPKLSRADDWLDFPQGAEACRRRILGLTPWPGVTAKFRGQDVKLTRADVASNALNRAEQTAGTILDPASGLIACGDGPPLQILEVHPAGKRPMPWADFARGQRIVAGEHLEPRQPGGGPHA
jgi:methionyl-tRNA formyltransferase